MVAVESISLFGKMSYVFFFFVEKKKSLFLNNNNNGNHGEERGKIIGVCVLV